MNLSWRVKTRSPVWELARHFFTGLFRSESFAGEDSFTVWLVQALALLVAASWFLPVGLFRRYMHLHELPEASPYLLAYSSDCLWTLTLVSLLTAFITVIEWPALFPSRRDHLVLSPLPITRAQIFFGKAAALSLFFSLFLIAITLLSSVALPVISEGHWETRNIFWRMVSLFTAAAGSGYFVFLALLATQGVLLLLLPARWFQPVSFALQMILLLLLLCSFPILPYLPVARIAQSRPGWLLWFPPAWFWGWNEYSTGGRDAAVVSLASRAEIGMLLTFFASSATYVLTYVRYTRLALESPQRRRVAIVAPAEWISALFRRSEARAVSSFMTNTLLRGRQQKLVFLLIAGIGLALVFENSVYLAIHAAYSRSEDRRVFDTAVLALPLTLSFFSFVALRRVFRIPIEPPANWIFRFLEHPPFRRVQLDAVFTTFLILGGFVPLVFCAPLEIILFRGRVPIALTAQAFLILILAEYLLSGWKSIPFTFIEEMPRRHLIHSMCLHFVELSIYSFTGASWIFEALTNPRSLLELLGLTAAAFVWLHRRRRREWASQSLQFIDPGPDRLEVLRLHTE